MSTYRVDYVWMPANAKTMCYKTMFGDTTKTTTDLLNTDYRAMICRVTLPETKAFKKVAWVPMTESDEERKAAGQGERRGERTCSRADPIGRFGRWTMALRGQAPAAPTGAQA